MTHSLICTVTPTKGPDSGMTLVELVIALGVTSVLLLGGTQLMIAPQKQMSQVGSKVNDEQNKIIEIKKLSESLSSSSIMKSGLIQCSGQTLNNQFLKCTGASGSCSVTDSVVKMDANSTSPFTFAFSDHSVLAAKNVDSSSGDISLVVPNISDFPGGSFVLVSDLNDPQFGAFFIVGGSPSGGAKFVANQLVLNPATALIPSEFGCQTIGKVSSLRNILNDPDHFIYGRSPTVFRIDRVVLVSYQVNKDGGRPKLEKKFWPSKDSKNPIVTSPAFTGFAGLDITLSWQPSNPDTDLRSGTMVSKIELTSSGMSGLPVKTSAIGQYTKAPTARQNFAQVVEAQPDVVSTPSCGLSITPLNGVFGSDGSSTCSSDQGYYLLSASSSLPPGSFPNFQVTLEAGPPNPSMKTGTSTPRCWPNATGGSGAAPKITGSGISGMFGMAMSGAGTVEPVICLLPNGSNASAAMTYVTPTNVSRTIGCSGVSSTVPTGPFVYASGQAPTCKRDGRINFGKLVSSTNPNESGPMLYVMNNSCYWKKLWLATPGTCDKAAHMDETLERVRLCPDNMTVSPNIYNPNATGAIYDITCTN